MTTDGNAASGAQVRKLLAELGGARLAASDVFPLSAVQQRIWLADQAMPGLPAYHLTRLIELDGPLDVPALTAALTDLVARHEALRTTILVVAGQPLQRAIDTRAGQLPVTDTTAEAADDLARPRRTGRSMCPARSGVASCTGSTPGGTAWCSSGTTSSPTARRRAAGRRAGRRLPGPPRRDAVRPAARHRLPRVRPLGADLRP